MPVSSVSAVVRRLTVSAETAAIATGAACSSAPSYQAPVSPLVRLMARFDSLRVAAEAESDGRAGQYQLVADFLAQGAPIQSDSLFLDGHLLVDSAVEVVDVEDVNGQPHDSSVFLIAWDGHGPDTVISVSVGPGFNGWQATWNGGSAGVTSSPPQPALGVAIAPPGRDCSSLLTEAPADLDPPVAGAVSRGADQHVLHVDGAGQRHAANAEANAARPARGVLT